MGHGVAAALNATLCIGSLRNTRNAGALLLDQVTSANQALAAHADSSGLEDFVTGLVGRLDLRTGSIELVNAGHVAPYLARGSEVTPIELPVDVPLGLFPDAIYRSTKVILEKEDRLALADRVLEVADGDLSDDATVLCLDWYGGHGHARSTRHGADPARTSPARS